MLKTTPEQRAQWRKQVDEFALPCANREMRALLDDVETLEGALDHIASTGCLVGGRDRSCMCIPCFAYYAVHALTPEEPGEG